MPRWRSADNEAGKSVPKITLFLAVVAPFITRIVTRMALEETLLTIGGLVVVADLLPNLLVSRFGVIPPFRLVLRFRVGRLAPRVVVALVEWLPAMLQWEVDMQYVVETERSNWRETAERVGFRFHTIDNMPYWDEGHAIGFSLDEAEQYIEDPTNDLYRMFLQAAGRVINDDQLMRRLRIPPRFYEAIRASWKRSDPALYGRLDLSYDGSGPAKLLEGNFDTPTALFEAAAFQWLWLEDAMKMGLIPQGCDQLNSMEEKMVAAFRAMHVRDCMYFAWYQGSDPIRSEEDRSTVTYLAEVAKRAGINARFVTMEAIRVDEEGQFFDQDDRPIKVLFKLYPWEWMMREKFGKHILTAKTRFVEPLWKAVLSNKGILAVLWDMFPNHPNLLPAFFADDPRVQTLRSYVRKPIYSREGAGITVVVDGEEILRSDASGYGGEGYVVQEWCPLPKFATGYAVIGSWIISGEACGIGIREDDTPITVDTSRFVPHVILP